MLLIYVVNKILLLSPLEALATEFHFLHPRDEVVLVGKVNIRIEGV